MVIPHWLSSYLKESDLQSLERDIAQIELGTEAEIVPVVVRSSSQYAQSQVTGALLATLVFVVLGECLIPYFYWDYLTLAVAFVVGALSFILWGVPRLTRIFWIRRLLTLRQEELEQCWKRARLEFYENRLQQTQDKVGVLIFVSLLEHVVIVLADQKISEKLPQETWQNVVEKIVAGLKKKEMAEGLRHGLRECSHLLIQNFPVKSDDKNELPNTLVIKE